MFDIAKKIKNKLLSTFNLQPSTKSGFSLIELLVVLAIITLITSVILINHSVFNGGVVLESLAYEIALITRQAQFFSVNVLGSGPVGSVTFETGYGVYFTTTEENDQNKQFIFFADLDDDGAYDGGDELIEIYTITRGNIVKNLCADSNCTGIEELHITFKRPDPDAVIQTDSPADCPSEGCGDAKIYVGSSNPKVKDKIITIGITGQISISTAQN